MNDQTLILDGESSENTLTCLRSELCDEADKHPVETIIKVKDENFRPYILLLDVDNNKYWRPYGGEKIEDIRIFHKWELEAQKKFKNEHRSTDELDYLRNILMSIWVLSNFFGFEEEMVNELMAGAITKIATKWYCTDKKLDEKTINVEEHDEQLKIYFSLASFYVSSFFATMTQMSSMVQSSS